MVNPAISAADRRYVFDRAHGCCEYCRNQQRYSTASLTVEYIIPLSKGGENILENLALACPACNAHKYAKLGAVDSLTRKLVPFFNPRTQSWEEHFTWDETLTIVIGLTPSGRATVNGLKMNREESVNLRGVLSVFGKHPPV